MTAAEVQKVKECTKRVKILIEGMKQLIDERQDKAGLIRGMCECGQVTRFGVCAACMMKRMREQQGL